MTRKLEMTINKPDKKIGNGGDAVVIKTKPGCSKDIGGGESEIWNQRQMRLLVSALPGINTADKAAVGEVGSAVVSGVMDLKPKDPIEGMLLAQIVVAHEAALDMYRRAWAQPPECFDARCRYIQLADKAQRTVAVLTERLDRHRGAGQQSITVRHVTVNADNAIVGNVDHFPGTTAQIKDQSNATAHALKPEMWSKDPERNALPITSDAERTLSDARGTIARRSEGQ
jgi:hypothetical protein